MRAVRINEVGRGYGRLGIGARRNPYIELFTKYTGVGLSEIMNEDDLLRIRTKEQLAIPAGNDVGRYPYPYVELNRRLVKSALDVLKKNGVDTSRLMMFIPTVSEMERESKFINGSLDYEMKVEGRLNFFRKGHDLVMFDEDGFGYLEDVYFYFWRV